MEMVSSSHGDNFSTILLAHAMNENEALRNMPYFLSMAERNPLARCGPNKVWGGNIDQHYFSYPWP